ncbi:isoleucine--tRNA ligase [Candidatus Parcubacteria bacterium]|jgi:isoleucyl-tRNA synthetase|nr:MAG: isoleucine--tRNA ligase [Candidatus Parcubacteria bacterium]
MLKQGEQFSLPEIEEKVLEFWKHQHIFEKTLKKKGTKKEFIFYEGPPTANGRPGIHHVLARSFKDVVLRYKTMRGYSVPRKGGWDTHGLPVELEVEKQLGIKSKKEIEEYGVMEFNAKCKESVWKYKDEWEKLTERMGYWLDMDDPYVTYENKYMESLWWIFKEIHKKKLLYKGHKIVPWCTRCGTALSSHELAQGYKEVEDTSVYIKFKVKKGEKIGDFVADTKTFILSWTTTPWTLPGNIALAVGEHIPYVIVDVGDTKKKEIYILAESRLSVLDGTEYTVLKTVTGKDLVTISYEPLFEIPAFVSGSVKSLTYKVYPAGFVTTEDGTGVVHTAVMYGEDDYQLGRSLGLPEVHTVKETGVFSDDVPYFAGMYAKTKTTETAIIQKLEEKNLLLRTEQYKHEYPFCWRCNTPLLYYGRHSWFIEMSSLRDVLKKENNTIHWIPDHLQTGRFGEWIKEVKDWAISRERYWGTPLPIWECSDCKEKIVIGSVEELEKKVPSKNNKYILIRHGESESNLANTLSSWPEKTKYHLTEKGKKQIEQLGKKIKKEKIDLIFSSDMVRTKETSAIIKEHTGAPIIFDERLREIDFGDFNGSPLLSYTNYYGSFRERFTKQTPNGESISDVRKRVYTAIKEIDEKYSGKTIAIVSHEDVLWALDGVMNGWSDEEAMAEKHDKEDGEFINMGKMKITKYRMIPRDINGTLDLHRPYIDSFEFSCDSCGHTMKRIPEVADVWFDSGAMPFAQYHYPFEGNKKTLPFPADYISEGIDQTRGWFYTLLAVSTLLGKEAPFKNVISLGLVLDKNGQKMSKSKGNVVSPWDVMQKYGSDVIRWYFYTVNPPGEPKKFDELDLQKVSRQFFSLVYNSFVFFDLYANKEVLQKKSAPKINNILDKWIIERLNQVIIDSTTYMDAYEVGEATRVIESFADDLSRWYIRRSRRRLQKPESKDDYHAVSYVLGTMLISLAKLTAPFAPFFSEAIYKSFPSMLESVHIEAWPKVVHVSDKGLVDGMVEVRRIASIALAKRAEAGIKVRQPLASITVKSKLLEGNSELLSILMDEVNIKDVLFNASMEDEVVLDTHVTQELKEEGYLRELQRTIQDLRQDAKLSPKDEVVIHIEVGDELQRIIESKRNQCMKDVNARELVWGKCNHFDVEIETKIDGVPIWIAVRKKK